jgi:hypothetical protein
VSAGIFPLAVALGLAAVACSSDKVVAVGSPGGVYRPGMGCTEMESSGDCTPAGGPGWQPQLRFESDGDPGLTVDTPERVSDAHVDCQRSYCGTGSYTAHADLQWDDSIDNDPRRMASFVHTFDPPLDMIGQTISFAAMVEGPTVPMHAQVGIVSDYWHWVGWAPLPGGWTFISGVVSADNPLIMLADPSVTSIPVSTIQIDVYVPMAPASGATGSWSGSIYLDDVGWQ